MAVKFLFWKKSKIALELFFGKVTTYLLFRHWLCPFGPQLTRAWKIVKILQWFEIVEINDWIYRESFKTIYYIKIEIWLNSTVFNNSIEFENIMKAFFPLIATSNNSELYKGKP